jgi:hypothetical protein
MKLLETHFMGGLALLAKMVEWSLQAILSIEQVPKTAQQDISTKEPAQHFSCMDE